MRPKQVSDSTLDQVRRYWNPSRDHYNWAHEIAVYVISLWLCGPACLAALQNVMEAKRLDSFQLGQSHPPYEVRARALIAAAGQLDWAYYTGGIQALVDRWCSSATAESKSNLLVACADPRLVSAAVDTALGTCRGLSLPQCTPSRVGAVETALNQGNPLPFGIDLILACWIKASETTETKFDQWERTIIRDLLAEITE